MVCSSAQRQGSRCRNLILTFHIAAAGVAACLLPICICFVRSTVRRTRCSNNSNIPAMAAHSSDFNSSPGCGMNGFGWHTVTVPVVLNGQVHVSRHCRIFLTAFQHAVQSDNGRNLQELQSVCGQQQQQHSITYLPSPIIQSSWTSSKMSVPGSRQVTSDFATWRISSHHHVCQKACQPQCQHVVLVSATHTHQQNVQNLNSLSHLECLFDVPSQGIKMAIKFHKKNFIFLRRNSLI